MTSFMVSVTQSIIPIEAKKTGKKKKKWCLLPHIYNHNPLKVAKLKRYYYMQHTLKGLMENSEELKKQQPFPHIMQTQIFLHGSKLHKPM